MSHPVFCQQFLAWAQALEHELQTRPRGMSLSRWYHADEMALYTRVGRTFRAADFRPALVLANIEIPAECQGQGRWRALVAALRAPGALQAQVLTVEQVHNERLATWLRCNGFEHYPSDDFGAPTFRCILKVPQG